MKKERMEVEAGGTKTLVQTESSKWKSYERWGDRRHKVSLTFPSILYLFQHFALHDHPVVTSDLLTLVISADLGSVKYSAPRFTRSVLASESQLTETRRTGGVR